MDEHNPDALNTLDFIGLNYYSHYYYKFSLDQEKLFDPHYKKDDIMTDMDYAFYPEGFYRAVQTLSQAQSLIIVEAEKRGHSLEEELEELAPKLYGLFRQYVDVKSQEITPPEPEVEAPPLDYSEDELFDGS